MPAMRNVRLVLLILIGLAVALGLGQTRLAWAEATTVTTNTTLMIDRLLPGAEACGEDIHLSGPVKALFHVTLDPSGGFHSVTVFNPQGVTGVGLTSGATYQGTGETSFFSNGRALPSQFTFENNFKIIGHGPANNLLVHETFHVTVNPDGTVTAFVNNFSSKCKK
ncbi:MAG TPA: hypothetical protein VJ793_21765 [Anaerolineae bacterium]|nr:hypothetical protein [Anaerolineae bacterium]